jgi:ribosome-associated protein
VPTALHVVPIPFEDGGAAIHLIHGLLDDAKAEDLVTIDLRGKSTLADAMIVASGRSARHVGAIVDRLVRELKDHGFGRIGVEGTPHCDWVLLDAGDVIVHVFRPEVRAFYNLEKMWAPERPVERAGA